MPTKKTNRSFVRLYHQYIDLGAVNAIGLQTFVVFMCIVRYTWRAKTASSLVLDELKRKGKIVAWADQSKIAIRLGIARSSVNRAVRTLKRIGWIKPVVIESNRRGYVVGFRSKRDRREIFYADVCMTRLSVAYDEYKLSSRTTTDEDRGSFVMAFINRKYWQQG